MAKYSFYPSHDDVDAFKEDLEDNLAKLAAHCELLQDQPGDIEFATSLIHYYAKNEKLSDKQLWHATRMFQELNASGSIRGEGLPFTIKKSQEAAFAEPIDVPRLQIDQDKGLELLSRFDLAIETIKYPSVLLPLENNEAIYDINALRFYRTGPRSQSPNCVGISNGKKDPDFLFLGTILRDGRLAFGSFCFGKPDLQRLLKEIIENFVAEAVIRGKKMGSCCFCCRELTHAVSLHHGYGPICASKYGLPWEGEKNVEEVIANLGMEGE